MGAEIRAHDWSDTSLGPPELWPPSLCVRLAQMLACPTAMFLAWGPELLCFYNDAYRPILGYRLPDALGRPFREVWASIWDEIEPLVEATLDGESQTLTDVMLDLSRAGRPERSWWSFTYSPALDDAGAINGLFCVTAETTDRVLGEAALRESEDHFRHTVELNPQVPWTCDPDGNITSYSNRWLELTGQGPGEPLGSGWVKALHPDDVPWTLTTFTAALTAGEPVDVDYRIHIAATGDFRWMRARAFPRRDEAGAIVRWYGVVEDVHDRKLAEARLQEMNATLERRVEEALVQRKLWADVFETTDALVCALDTEFRVLAANRAWIEEVEAVYGVWPRIGDNLLDLLSHRPEMLVPVRSTWSRALARRGVHARRGLRRPAASTPALRDEIHDVAGRAGGADRRLPVRPGRHRASARAGAARPRRGDAEAYPEAGGDRAAHRRRGARLQQHADHHPLVGRVPAPPEPRGGAAHPLPGGGLRHGGSRRQADEPAACLRPTATPQARGVRGRRASARLGGHAERRDGRAHPHRHGGAGAALPRAGRREPVRDRPHQPCRQRPGRHGRRGHSDPAARQQSVAAPHSRRMPARPVRSSHCP